MKVDIFDFELPANLIAQTPIKRRDDSRLLMVDKTSGDLKEGRFGNILDLLQKGDCLVLNDTRVIPARLIGHTTDTHAPIELLLLRRIDDTHWESLVRPGKKLRPGRCVSFGEGELTAEIKQVLDGGNRIAKFHFDGIFEEVLDRLGEMPLPHYITEKLQDKERYQTVYSKHSGSAAAPTAGLHFTTELLQETENRGISVAYLTLHVGLGTFRPVKADNVEDHLMHREYYTISSQAADKINAAKQGGGRIVAVGTTSVRTLESVADENGHIRATSESTDIFIYPGYRFKIVDGMITNFHLPKSSLIMLVCAFGGYDYIMRAYKYAIDQQFRFYSFGDSMMIL